jgi:uncharacterized damage-inducible protein DinB
MRNNRQEITLLLQIIDEAYKKKAWHGPNLRGSIKGLTAKQAAWRPAPNRHNIWEIVVHAAYWKYVVRRRLLGEKRGSFSLKGSNWFVRPRSLSEAAWREDIALLDNTHREMRDAISTLPTKSLHSASKGSSQNTATLVYGIAAHDVYHAGQIQLLKRMQR